MINTTWTKMIFAMVALISASTAVHAAPVTFSSSGANAAAIQTTVDNFRTTLGALNPNTPGTFGSGRREINWDAAPDAVSTPNSFPGNFFNANFAPRARGAVFSTTGTDMHLSSTVASAVPTLFSNINPTYATQFQTFSPQRLFTALDSTGAAGNVVDVDFFIPGSATPAVVSGFGAVFVDVDSPNSTSIEYFNAANVSLGSFAVPVADQGLSFLGVFFNAGEGVARVRITSGDSPIDGAFPDISNAGNLDAVVMDDFIFGEPVPEPTSLALLLFGVTALAARRIR